MYPFGGGFRNAIDGMRFLSAHPNLDNAGIIFHQLSDCFPAQSPQTGKITDPIMLLECGVFYQHVEPVTKCLKMRGQ